MIYEDQYTVKIPDIVEYGCILVIGGKHPMKNRWSIPDDDPDTTAQMQADMAPEEPDYTQDIIDYYDLAD